MCDHSTMQHIPPKCKVKDRVDVTLITASLELMVSDFDANKTSKLIIFHLVDICCDTGVSLIRDRRAADVARCD